MLGLAGCTARASRQASVPAPPTPEAPVNRPPDQPLSIPQTSARLPTVQELNPAAIPRDPVAPQEPGERTTAEKVEPPPAKSIPKRAAAQPPKPEPTANTPPAGTPEATEEPVAAAQPATELAPFQPILSAEQQNQLKNSIATRKREVASLLAKAADHSGNDQTLVENIKSFVKLADEAEQRGDYTRADSLAVRALNLAQDLKVE